MFGFFRKSTTAVTTDVTAEPELTAEPTTVVTTAVTTSTVSSSLIVEKWAEPKPFPPPEDRPVQFWPANDMPSPRAPSPKQIAEELFAAMQAQPTCVGQWILAYSIEATIYPFVCQQLGWPLRPWKGKNGVAFHLGRLSGRRPEYKRTEINGEARNLAHYYIPHPQSATVSQLTPRRRQRA